MYNQLCWNMALYVRAFAHYHNTRTNVPNLSMLTCTSYVFRFTMTMSCTSIRVYVDDGMQMWYDMWCYANSVWYSWRQPTWLLCLMEHVINIWEHGTWENTCNIVHGTTSDVVVWKASREHTDEVTRPTYMNIWFIRAVAIPLHKLRVQHFIRVGHSRWCTCTAW